MVSIREILSGVPIYYKAWIEFPLTAINISEILRAKISPSQMRLLIIFSQVKTDHTIIALILITEITFIILIIINNNSSYHLLSAWTLC